MLNGGFKNNCLSPILMKKIFGSRAVNLWDKNAAPHLFYSDNWNYLSFVLQRNVWPSNESSLFWLRRTGKTILILNDIRYNSCYPMHALGSNGRKKELGLSRATRSFLYSLLSSACYAGYVLQYIWCGGT